ncbi:UDP-glucose 4-epimerase GalE [Caenispirillum salinarum]|uniref:UDP-glucose 4-epimerase GalE n=1 Tax=Caenispirillum salinarum TaxID=859058 RepID=UPI0038511200
MQSVLVIGGAGYVGSHACKALAAHGFCPVVYDNLSTGHRWAVRWGPLIQGDLSDRGCLDAAFAKTRPVAVMQFAASIEVGLSMRDPAAFYANNLVNTLTLLNAMRAAAVPLLVFSSTAAVYGMPTRTPIDEQHTTIPVNPYGESKLAVERALHWHDAAYGMRYAALRYFNAAGADPDGLIGEAHEPETHLIPLILRAQAPDAKPLKVFGNDYDTVDGTAVRDYIHVSDLAEAHVAALRHLLGGGASLTVNLGTGHGWSIRHVIDTVERVTGRLVHHQIAPRRAGDPPVLVADSSRAARLLGWQPRLSGLEDIVRTAHAWHAGEVAKAVI